MTDRYAVIGHPVAHSKSPWIHESFARATGQDLSYERIDAPPDAFQMTLARFCESGGRGTNVTQPFKGDAYRQCATLSARARDAGAVNTITFTGELAHGDNTDGVGLVRDLRTNLAVRLGDRRVLLIGAGGAAQGVLRPLLDERPACLCVANRTADRARALAARFAGLAGGSSEDFAGVTFDVVINATSAGLAGELPFEAAALRALFAPGAIAYDMVYGRDTPFLAAARSAGARACDGLGMLVEQAAESFQIWRGVRPDTREVLRALRAA